MTFHIDKRMARAGDPQRIYTYEVLVPKINQVCDSISDPEDFVIRCRNAMLPSRGNEPIESFFFGMKQKFPGKPIFDNVMTLLIEEFEDQLISRAIYEWNENVFSTNPDDPDGGSSKKETKRDGYATDVIINMYKQNGDLLDYRMRLFHCFPETLDAVQLDYATSDTIKYSLTLSYDYFTWERS